MKKLLFLLSLLLSAVADTMAYESKYWDVSDWTWDDETLQTSQGTLQHGIATESTYGEMQAYKLTCPPADGMSEYTLLLAWNPEERMLDEYLSIPKGWMVLDHEGNEARIPATLKVITDGEEYDEPITYIEFDYPQFLWKFEIEKGDQRIIWNNFCVVMEEELKICRPVIFMNIFFNDPELTVFDPDMTVFPRGLRYLDFELTVPDQFTTLGDSCFFHSDLNYVYLPPTLDSIGNNCFEESKIMELKLPYCLKHLGNDILLNSDVTSVWFPWLNSGYHYDPTADGAVSIGEKLGYNVNWQYTFHLPVYTSPTEGIYKDFFTNPVCSYSYSSSYICYKWVDGKLSEMKMADDLSSWPKTNLKPNEVAVMTLPTEPWEGKNIINLDASGNYWCKHLVVGIDGDFRLPVQTRCDNLSLYTKQKGWLRANLPYAVASGSNTLIGHQLYTSDSFGTCYLPTTDSIQAKTETIALRTSSSDTIAIYRNGSSVNGEQSILVDTFFNAGIPDLGDLEYPIGYTHPSDNELQIPAQNSNGSYIINNIGELYFLETYGAFVHDSVLLGADLHLDAENDQWHTLSSFDGHFDGRGHTISGINIVEGLDDTRLGFIGLLDEGGSIEQLNLQGTAFEAEPYTKRYSDVGGLVAYSKGIVSHCMLSMNVKANASNLGILVGLIGPKLNTPTCNFVVGNLYLPNAQSSDRYGVFNGGWNVSRSEADAMFRKDFDLAFDVLNDIWTNYTSNTTKIMVNNSYVRSDLISPKCYEYTLFDSEDLGWQLENRWSDFNYLDSKDIRQGRYACEWSSGSKALYLRQNVSSPMAPLDSLPLVRMSNEWTFCRSSNSAISNCKSWLPYHNCADFTGAGYCPICNKRTKLPQDDVIDIADADQLFAFAKLVNSTQGVSFWHARLTADIDLQDKAWTPIGNNTVSGLYETLCQSGIYYTGCAFRGIFDGQGHTVSGLNVSGTNNQGFFGVLHDNAIVCNLTLEGKVEGEENVGAVAGLMSRSEVSAILSHVEVKGEKHTGGLIGAMVGRYAKLANSFSLGTVTAPQDENTANGRVVGIADDGRNIGFDIQPVTIQNVFCYKKGSDDDLDKVGSGNIGYFYSPDSLKFQNGEVNQLIRNKDYFFPQLFSFAYHLTDSSRLPSCPVDSTLIPGYTPKDTLDGTLRLVDGWYEISNYLQLQKFAELVNSQKSQILNARLTADVDLQGMEWTPMGNDKSKGIVFSGRFDGQGHCIRGLHISSGYQGNAGLFGAVDNGIIKRLEVEGDGVYGTGYVGAIAGILTNSSHVMDCLVDCPVFCTAQSYYAGGIAGTVDASNIRNCIVLSQATNTATSGKNCGLIVGSVPRTKNSAVLNNFYTQSGKVYYYGNSRNVGTNVSTTLSSIASGETVYQLVQQAQVADSTQWGQTFGTDYRPHVGDQQVYKAATGLDIDYYNIDTLASDPDILLRITAHHLNLNDQTDSLSLPEYWSEIRAVEMSYERKGLKGYNSICLPANLWQDSIPQGLVIGSLTDCSDVDADNPTITFAQSEMLPANEPGILYPGDADYMGASFDMSLNFTPAANDSLLYELQPRAMHSVQVGQVTLSGAYQTTPTGADHYKLSDDGRELLCTTSQSHVYPYRWYLTIGGTRAVAASRCRISVSTPGISTLDETRGNDGLCFDLYGRRIQSVQGNEGLIISNKKKIKL